jgi:hypothetical protein
MRQEVLGLKSRAMRSVRERKFRMNILRRHVLADTLMEWRGVYVAQRRLNSLFIIPWARLAIDDVLSAIVTP